MVGLCGALYGQFQGASDVNMGRGAIVIGLAAVIIGEVLFGKFASKRKLAFAFTLASVILGAVIYYMVYQFVLWLKMPSEDMKLFSAIVVAIFLACYRHYQALVHDLGHDNHCAYGDAESCNKLPRELNRSWRLRCYQNRW